MPKEYNKVLKYNHGEKSLKHRFIIYADLECLLKKISTCHNNPEISSTTKKYEHTPTGYSMFTRCSFYATKNKLDYYRGRDCLQIICKDLKEHATKIISYEKKEMMPSIYKTINFIKSKRFFIYAKRDLVLMMIIKSTIKSEIIVIKLEHIEELLIVFVT